MKTAKIKSIKKIDKQQYKKVYDVVMSRNPHTFFCNDVLVHNSCYFRINEAENIDEAIEIGKKVVEACDDKAIPFLVSRVFNGDTSVMKSDFEIISRATLAFGKKKQYAFLMSWKDGETLAKPKLKVTGLSIKRTDSPASLNKRMQPFFIDIMKGLSHKEIFDKVEEIKEEYYSLDIKEAAAKRTANNLYKYYKAFEYEIIFKKRPYDIDKLYGLLEKKKYRNIKIPDELLMKFMYLGKGRYSVDEKNKKLVEDPNGEIVIKVDREMVIPFHIKASIFYNYLIDEFSLNSKFNKIVDGEKIKVIYIKPIKKEFKIYKSVSDCNKLGIDISDKVIKGKLVEFDGIMEMNAIAFPSSLMSLPDFFKNFKFDKEKMLKTYFIKKLDYLFEIIGFDYDRMQNSFMDDLF